MHHGQLIGKFSRERIERDVVSDSSEGPTFSDGCLLWRLSLQFLFIGFLVIYFVFWRHKDMSLVIDNESTITEPLTQKLHNTSEQNIESIKVFTEQKKNEM